MTDIFDKFVSLLVVHSATLEHSTWMLKFVYYNGIIIQTDVFLNNMVRPRISGSKEEK